MLKGLVKNSAGKIFYGMHFYPGVAEYAEPGKDPYRIFINEDTIRNMNPTFAGRPVFVEHVDEVDSSIDELKKDADGWVVESFFNKADGKTWVKFIVVSERAERAIKNGFRLSNAYLPKSFGNGSLWNGVSYSKEVTSGEFEHLAIVRTPRYDESVILTPEQFKNYNEEREVELKRLANAKNENEKEIEMGFTFFKKEKIANSLDIESTSVLLPKSKKEKSIAELVSEADEAALASGKPRLVNESDEVMMDEVKMSVGDVLAKLKACLAEIEGASSKEVDMASMDNKEDEEKAEDKKENKEDEAELDKKVAAEKKENKEEPVKKMNTKNDNFKKLANAQAKVAATQSVRTIELMNDKVARGKSRYGA